MNIRFSQYLLIEREGSDGHMPPSINFEADQSVSSLPLANAQALAFLYTALNHHSRIDPSGPKNSLGCQAGVF